MGASAKAVSDRGPDRGPDQRGMGPRFPYHGVSIPNLSPKRVAVWFPGPCGCARRLLKKLQIGLKPTFLRLTNGLRSA